MSTPPGRTIVTLDGGGTAGVFTYNILRHLMDLPETRIDLIVGVSAGAVLGALVASGRLLQIQEQSVQRDIRTLFGEKSASGPWWAPIYTGVGKVAALRRMFGEMLFGELSIDFVILIDRLRDTPVLFKSWDPSHAQIPLVQLLDATSAYPLLFPPVQIQGHPGQYIDGGTVTASPTGLGYLVGTVRFPKDVLWLLSIGTVRPPRTKAVDPATTDPVGVFEILAAGLLPKVVAQRGWLVNELTQEVLGPRYFRIEGVMELDIDNVSSFESCMECARQVWRDQSTIVRAFLRLAHGKALGIDQAERSQHRQDEQGQEDLDTRTQPGP